VAYGDRVGQDDTVGGTAVAPVVGHDVQRAAVVAAEHAGEAAAVSHDADVHNAREAPWARSRSPADVVARLDAEHGVFTSLLESLRADELTDHRYRNYVEHMCTEFDAHLEELQDLLLTA
jgi:hypothetical protein